MSITENMILAVAATLWIGSVVAANASALFAEAGASASFVATGDSTWPVVPDQRTSDAPGRSTIAVPAEGIEAGLRVAEATSDTLHHEIRAGETLIIALPDEIDGRAVDRYSLLQAPALSWLVDRSFMWRTAPEDTGRQDVLIGAESRPDTLVVTIVVY